MRLYTALFICIISFAHGAFAQAAESSSPRPPCDSDCRSVQEEFVHWARKSLTPIVTLTLDSKLEDLEPLGKMVGTASVVSLSEGVHMGAEPLEFRNRVLEYLVKHKGFTAIAIESGIVEGRVVHDHVRSGRGDVTTVVADGISWTMDRLPQNQELVRWLREYNADPRHVRKINFYGFDVPGSPGNPIANRGPQTALEEVFKYLDKVDAIAAGAFHSRVDSFLGSIRFDPHPANGAPNYSRLTQPERDQITSTIADMISLLEREEAHYVAASSLDDYKWAYRDAIGARQVDEWLRQMPIGWNPLEDQGEFQFKANNTRDRAQADNLDWIIKQEGSEGKILVFAHRYHLSSVSVEVEQPVRRELQPMGTYLRRRYGSSLFTIGNLIGGGHITCADVDEVLKEAPSESIDGLAGEVGVPLYLLDLRMAPTRVKTWLDQLQPIWQENYAINLRVGRAYNAIFYVHAITPACADSSVK